MILALQETKRNLELCLKEGWETEISKKTGENIIWADGLKCPVLHPYQILLRLYRDAKDPVAKYGYMKRVHDWLWPHYVSTWNQWEEERFRAHCEGFLEITLAAGAAAGKSLTAAKIACIFYLSDQRRNAVVVASTTLESLESRIWGYVASLMSSVALPINIKIMTGKPPKIVMPGQTDKIHGMFAIAIRQGEDAKVLGTLIGRHPDKGIMIVLDEATDMNPAITKSLPNLTKGVEFFQLFAIGNSNSKNDLHGALATPKDGWDSINPLRDTMWRTARKGGICIYNNPYTSPAITDPDPAKRELLAKFLPTTESLVESEGIYGKESEAYWRFVMGFWKSQSADNTIISQQFIEEHRCYFSAEWGGWEPLQICGGLDPAFQIGGTGCVLRLARLGQGITGKIMLDYYGTELLFPIEMRADKKKSGELQCAEQIVEICKKYSCPVGHIAMDATGVGRALGELIRLVSGESVGPYRVVSTRFKTHNGLVDPNITVVSPSEMWLRFRDFVQSGHIKGLDHETIGQLTSRLVGLKGTKLILESKSEYKSRMAAINPRLAHSPDEADATILCLHAAILRFGFFPGQERPISVSVGDRDVQEKIMRWTSERKIEEADVKKRVRLVANFSSSLEDKVQ